MNWKEILLIPLPIFIPIVLVPLFSTISLIQPTLYGLDIVDWMRAIFYIISPIVYFAYIAFLYFKLKIKFSVGASVISFVIGVVAISSYIIPLENLLIPSLTPVGLIAAEPQEDLSLVLRSIFRNILFFNYLYFSLVVVIALFRKFKERYSNLTKV